LNRCRLSQSSVTIAFIWLIVILAGCRKELLLVDRHDAIPAGAIKMTPALDTWPPVLLSSDWEDPVPMPGPVNTRGGEDSPFITPDGEWFFFFFTPDVSIPAEQQLTDGCTGMYWARRDGNGWTEPERVVLNDDVSLDGCQYVRGDSMWFCSVRANDALREGPEWYTAVLRNGKWTDWRNAGAQLNLEYEVGELHITADGRTMYCARTADKGGEGGFDLWSLERNATGWDPPVHLGAKVNGQSDDGWPFVSSDGRELWFCANSTAHGPGPGLYRCLRDSTGEWTEPEEIVSRFAGEPTLDDEGNIYFTHHFYTGSGAIRMIEADIYVCYRK
jgi:hypothetical protein